MTTSPFKGRTGLKRVLNATGYSLAGFSAAFRGEAAFRQLVLLNVVLVPLAVFFDEESDLAGANDVASDPPSVCGRPAQEDNRHATAAATQRTRRAVVARRRGRASPALAPASQPCVPFFRATAARKLPVVPLLSARAAVFPQISLTYF